MIRNAIFRIIAIRRRIDTQEIIILIILIILATSSTPIVIRRPDVVVSVAAEEDPAIIDRTMVDWVVRIWAVADLCIISGRLTIIGSREMVRNNREMAPHFSREMVLYIRGMVVRFNRGMARAINLQWIDAREIEVYNEWMMIYVRVVEQPEVVKEYRPTIIVDDLLQDCPPIEKSRPLRSRMIIHLSMFLYRYVILSIIAGFHVTLNFYP